MIWCTNYGIKNGNLDCAAAEYETCKGQACPFYIEHHQAQSSKERAYKRLRNLPSEQQELISAKYYHNEMPWINQ